ncbi:MAG TPA: glycosyltransferase family 39 protein [Gemmatimonadales bacterium]|nr:glycosyltransferase family 39 protein [Gemmatimonadales bacterium]
MADSDLRWGTHLHNLLTARNAQRWSVALVVLLGLFLRLYAAWLVNQHQPDSPARLIGDEPGYNNTALELLRGEGFTWLGRVPLYPAWLASVHWLTGTSYHALRYAQAFLGATTVLLTYLLGRRVFGHTVGLLTALLTAGSYVLIQQSIHLLSEVLFTPVVMLTALALWNGFQAPSKRAFALAGVCIGLSDLIRPTLLMLPVFLVFPLAMAMGWRHALRWGSVVVIATLIVIGPWLIHLRLRYHAWIPLATSNAILWQGSPEYYRLLHDQGYTYMRIWSEVIYGPGWQQHDPTSVEGDRWWTARAIRSIKADPLTYLKFATEKAGTYWVGDPNADWNNERVFSYRALLRAGFSRPAANAVMIGRLMPVLALVAIFALWRERRRLLPIYAILLYCTLLHAATHAEVRLSEPFHPLLWMLVTGAAVSWWNRIFTSPAASLPHPAYTGSPHLD